MKAKRQIAIAFPPGWGGKRKGAGRARVLPGRPRGPHVKRAQIPARIPVHVTVRISEEVESLRVRSALRVVARAIWEAQDRFDMRITHFTLESNHLHLIVEGLCAAGMKGLGVRIAKGIHRLRRTSGPVIGDRYFPRPLRSPPQVKNAIHYVLYNHKHHTGLDMPDEFSSALQPQIVVAPRTWLLQNPAARRGRISTA